MNYKITKVVWDSNLIIVERVIEPYNGPWAFTKGSASKTEQAAADQQRTQENQLAQQQLALQQQQLSSVNAAVDPTINSILQGGTPAVLGGLESALTSSYMNQLPQAYRQGIGQINQNLVARGLSGGPSGAGGGGIGNEYGSMMAALGNAQQQGATNTALTMNQQKLGLLQNDLGLKMGLANAYGSNVGGFNQGALSALGQGVTAAQNVDQAQTSWMGPVFGALGGMGSSLMTGGMSNLGKGQGFFGCWVASECYGGMDIPIVQFIRQRLFQNAQQSWKFKVILAAYAIFGRMVAKLVRKSNWLKTIFTNIFDKFAGNELDKLLDEAIKNG